MFRRIDPRPEEFGIKVIGITISSELPTLDLFFNATVRVGPTNQCATSRPANITGMKLSRPMGKIGKEAVLKIIHSYQKRRAKCFFTSTCCSLLCILSQLPGHKAERNWPLKTWEMRWPTPQMAHKFDSLNRATRLKEHARYFPGDNRRSCRFNQQHAFMYPVINKNLLLPTETCVWNVSNLRPKRLKYHSRNLSRRLDWV